MTTANLLANDAVCSLQTESNEDHPLFDTVFEIAEGVRSKIDEIANDDIEFDVSLIGVASLLADILECEGKIELARKIVDDCNSY